MSMFQKLSRMARGRSASALVDYLHGAAYDAERHQKEFDEDATLLANAKRVRKAIRNVIRAPTGTASQAYGNYVAMKRSGGIVRVKASRRAKAHTRKARR